MKNNYRQIIRLICVGILLVAAVVVLVHKGAIPRFWEQTAQVSAPVDEEDIPGTSEDGSTGDKTAQGQTETDQKPDGLLSPEAGDDMLSEEAEGGVQFQGAGDSTQTAQAGADTQPTEAADPSLDVENVPGSSRVDSGQQTEQSPQELLDAYLADDPRTPTEVKGIFVTGAVAGTVNTMPELTQMVEDTSLNAMVIDIKNDAGEVTYKMGLPLSAEIGAEVRYVKDMPQLIRQLKAKNIYLIARIVAFKDPILAEKKPEYAVKNPDGSVFHDNNGLAWVNPYNEEVWDYLIDLSKQAVELGFDEIQYDYIRFSTAKGISEADFGAVSEGKTRQDAINGFLTRAYETLAPMGVYVSADVFGTIICNESDGELIGQDYVEMAKHCDYICPMIYPSHYVNNAYGIPVPDAKPYELIYAAVEDGEKKLAAAREADLSVHLAKQRPWLQAFTATWVQGHIPYREKELQEQMKGAADAGVQEWLLWNAANNYDNVKNGL